MSQWWCAPQGFQINGYEHVVSYLNLSGPDVNFYAFQTGTFNYNLAAGDSLTYEIYDDIYIQGSSAQFNYFLNTTTTTPGNYSINLDVPNTYLTDLYSIDDPGIIISDFVLSAEIVRGSSSVGDSTVDFDPGSGVLAASVPEPSSIVLSAISLLGCAGALPFAKARKNGCGATT